MNAIEELTVRMVSTDLSKEFPLFQRTWKKVSMTESVLAMPEVKYGYLCKFPPDLSTDGLAGNLYKKGWAQEYLCDVCIATFSTDTVPKRCQWVIIVLSFRATFSPLQY